MIERQYTDEAMQILKEDAFEALCLQPEATEEEWTETMINEYSIEIADAFGAECAAHSMIKAHLHDIWCSEYHDETTGETHTFDGWKRLILGDGDNSPPVPILDHC